MKIKKTALASLLATTLFTSAAFAATPAAPAASLNLNTDAQVITPVLTQSGLNPAQALIPQPPELDAAAYVLMDANSGQIIAAKDMNARRAPASLTKLMTLYLTEKALADGRLTLQTPVHISKEAWSTSGSKMFVPDNGNVSVQDLMTGIIVDSGNDAAVALAQEIAGSTGSFVELMNQQAQLLGMKNTQFKTVDGLPDYNGVQFTAQNQYSSAYDLALLARAVINNYPQYYSLFDQKEFTFSGIKQENRNRLVFTDPSVDGLKTGYTKEAGYCLIASAHQDGMRLIAVALGAQKEADRDRDDQKLLTYGFSFYNTIKKFEANTAIASAPVSKGVERKIPAGVSTPFYVTIPRGQENALSTQIQLNTVTADLAKDAPVGTVTASLNGHPIAQQTLVALQADKKAGLMREAINGVENTL